MAGRLVTIVALGLAGVGIQTWLRPVLNHLGVTRSVTSSLNEQSCKPVHGLEACEDHWIHRESGISYLPCSTLGARQNWCPAMDMLNATGVREHPGDTVKMYDTNTGTVSTISIEGTPAHLSEMHLHAIDAWIDPTDSEKLTFFLNNHGVPAGGDAHEVGSDSTIEIFETRLGSKTWKHIQTVRHPLVQTPNNLLATGPRSFYVSNDHFHKTSAKRILPLVRLPGATSNVIHCVSVSASGLETVCMVAASGFQYPNGLAKGPDSTIYVASTALGEIKQMHIQADHTLTEGDLVANVQRPIDNIHVDEKGNIMVATLPKVLHFVDRAKKAGGPSAVEVYKVSNQTSDEKFYGQKYTHELIMADASGTVAPGMTNSQLYKGKLYLTGLTTPTLMVCEDESFKSM